MIHLHRYRIVRDARSHDYRECRVCGKRKIVVKMVGGYFSVDRGWLRGGRA